MTEQQIKEWIVKKASVTMPYRKQWSVSVTLGADINEAGYTIEKAYNALTKRIYESKYLTGLLKSTNP